MIKKILHPKLPTTIKGFLIDEEEFEVTPVTRKLLMFEVNTKNRMQCHLK